MLPFKLVCAPTFYLPIGQGVFPVSKYRLMYEHLLEKGIAALDDFVGPARASDEDILLVHTTEYVQKLRTGIVSTSCCSDSYSAARDGRRTTSCCSRLLRGEYGTRR